VTTSATARIFTRSAGRWAIPQTRPNTNRSSPRCRKSKTTRTPPEKFLADSGNPPHFLALVGGAIELPQYICDIHTKYKFWDLQIDYVPSDTPLATMRTDVDYSRFVKPDVGVGRIIADDVLDATLLLTRTFFRKEWLPGGNYAALAPKDWEKHSVVFDGHRLNQPDEGGSRCFARRALPSRR